MTVWFFALCCFVKLYTLIYQNWPTITAVIGTDYWYNGTVLQLIRPTTATCIHCTATVVCCMCLHSACCLGHLQLAVTHRNWISWLRLPWPATIGFLEPMVISHRMRKQSITKTLRLELRASSPWWPNKLTYRLAWTVLEANKILTKVSHAKFFSVSWRNNRSVQTRANDSVSSLCFRWETRQRFHWLHFCERHDRASLIPPALSLECDRKTIVW